MMNDFKLIRHPEKESFLLFLKSKYQVSIRLIMKSWLVQCQLVDNTMNGEQLILFSDMELEQLNQMF